MTTIHQTFTDAGAEVGAEVDQPTTIVPADIIMGTKTVARPGQSITMPIGNKDDHWVFVTDHVIVGSA